MMTKILEFCDDVEREKGVLQPYLDEYSKHILQKENKRDTKRKQRKPPEVVNTTSHVPITIDAEIKRIRTWAKTTDPDPPAAFIHQRIFNSNYPVDVLNDLRHTDLEIGWRRQRTAQLYTKLTHLSRYIKPVDRTDIDRTLSPLDPQARCYNCSKFIQLKYKANRKIPDRTEKTVCQCNSGRIQRAKMDEHISQQRNDWTAEKKRKKRQKEKHERHIKRSAVNA